MSSPTRLRAAVITPYHAEPLEVLRNCYESVLSQSVPCTHFMVADGRPRVIWQSTVARRIPCAHNPKPTVAYRTKFQVHYSNLGEPAPPGAKSNAESTGTAMIWWNSLPQHVRNEWGKYYFGSPLS